MTISKKQILLLGSAYLNDWSTGYRSSTLSNIMKIYTSSNGGVVCCRSTLPPRKSIKARQNTKMHLFEGIRELDTRYLGLEWPYSWEKKDALRWSLYSAVLFFGDICAFANLGAAQNWEARELNRAFRSLKKLRKRRCESWDYQEQALINTPDFPLGPPRTWLWEPG